MCIVLLLFCIIMLPSSVRMASEAVATFQLLQGFIDRPLADSDGHVSGKSLYKELVNAIKVPLTLVDLNYILFHCHREEEGVYNIPGCGPLTYCGLQGEIE